MLIEPPDSELPGGSFCPNCGAPVEPGYRFCQNCGAALTGPVEDPHPIHLTAAYPGKLSRLSTGFRIVLVVPLVLMVVMLGGWIAIVIPYGLLVLPGIGTLGTLIGGLVFVHWVVVLIRGRPVRWLFDAMVAIQRFVVRANAYVLLMADRYPPFEGDWHVTYEADYPERLQRRQLLVWKSILSIPHLIALAVVGLLVGVLVLISWFVILFTREYPRGFYNFVAGWLRWSARVNGYWMSLTDVFPAFGFSAEGGRGNRTSYVLSSVAGAILFFAGIGGVGTLIAWPADVHEERVSYADLLAGRPSAPVEAGNVRLRLEGAEDPYELFDGLLQAKSERRLVLFYVAMLNFNREDVWINEGDFRLKDSRGDRYRPVLVTVDGLDTPRKVEFAAGVYVLFEVREDMDPSELTFTPSIGFKEKAKFTFTR